MKTEAEIQRAHDILVGVLLGELPVPMSEKTRCALHASADVLCWILGDDHNNTFPVNLDKIEQWAHTNGYKISLAPEPSNVNPFTKPEDEQAGQN